MDIDTNPTAPRGKDGTSIGVGHAPAGEDVFTTVVGPDRDPSTAVAEAVATVAGVDPRTLGPLYRSIDPGVIDDFIGGVRESGTLSFRSAGHVVSIHGDGRVHVRSHGHRRSERVDPTTSPTAPNG